MHPFFKKVEHFNSRLIPYSLIILLVIIILEFTYHNENPTYLLTLQVIDYLIITIFVIDLIFIALKCRTTKYFFKNYYLDIIAVFPFSLFFKFINEVYRALRIAKEFSLGQAVFHETLEARKGVTFLARTGKLSKYLKVIARSIRLLTKSRFFTKITRHQRSKKSKRKVVKKKRKRR